MRKHDLIIYRLTSISEVLFITGILNFFMCYVIDCRTMTICSYNAFLYSFVFLIAEVVFYIVMEIIYFTVTQRSTGNRRLLSSVRNPKMMYSDLSKKWYIRTSYVWRKFVCGLYIQVFTRILLLVSVSVTCAFLLYKSIYEGWQYFPVVTSLLSVSVFACLFAAYRDSRHLFRSGAGLFRYMIVRKKSIYDVNCDFKNANKISNDLYISDNAIYYRNSTSVSIIDLLDVKNYVVGTNIISLCLYSNDNPEKIMFNTDREFNAVCFKLLRSNI